MADAYDHNELIYTLAAHLRAGGWICFPNVTLGSSWGDAATGRADLLAMKPSYRGHQTSIYEVKVSRADFLGDVRSGKFERYFDSCSKLFFATPSGLVKKPEVPVGCGLITTKDGTSWHSLKAATPREFEPDAELLLACIFSAHPAGWKKGRNLAGGVGWSPELVRGERPVRDLEARLLAAKNAQMRQHSTQFGRDVACKLATVEKFEEMFLKGINVMRDALGEDPISEVPDGDSFTESVYLDELYQTAGRVASKLREAERHGGNMLHVAAARLIGSVVDAVFPQWGKPDPAKIEEAVQDFRDAVQLGEEHPDLSPREKMVLLRKRRIARRRRK